MTRPFPSCSRHVLVALLGSALLLGCSGQSEGDLLASGKQLMVQKDLAAAIIEFKNVLQKQPDSKEARLLLGKALLELGDPVAAMVELQKAQELQAAEDEVVPPLARAMLYVGDELKLIAQLGAIQLADPAAAADLQTTLATAHLVRGDAEKSRAHIEAALRRVPGYTHAMVLQARLTASEGDYDAALVLLEPVLAKGDSDGRAGLLKGEILWQGKKDNDAALAVFQTVLKAHPKAVGAHTATISILSSQGKVDAVRAQIESLKKALPDHPEALLFSAQQAYADTDYKGSREITDRLLKVMPENPRVLELAGAADFRLNQFTQAEAFLAKTLKISPGRHLSRQLLAQTYMRTNQPAKAVELLTPALEGKNPDAMSLTLAGQALGMIGDTKKAYEAFARAEKVAPADPRVRTSAALVQMARGNSAAAISQLQAVAGDDKGAGADIALVSARMSTNDIAGALKAIDGLERKIPDSPVAANLRGRVLLMKRDIPAATRAFEDALAKDKNYFPAVASLAAIDLAAGRADGARKRLEEQTRTQPRSHEAWLALSDLAVRTGEAPEVAVRHLRSAVKASGGNAAPHLALVNHLIAKHDGNAALAAAREASTALPNNLSVMDALGRALILAGNREQAVTTFKQLAALQPTNPGVHLRLAEALVSNKDPEGARKSLKHALELNPELVQAQRALVALALMENKPAEGLALVRQMQRKDPKDAIASGLEGDIELSRKNWDDAAAAYRKALQFDRNTEAAIRLHALLRLAGKAAEADTFAAEWMKDRPKDAAFRYHLGDSLLVAQPAQAESHYRAVLEIQPDHALAMNNIAWLLVRQGKPGAVALAQKANELMPGRPQLMDTLAQALGMDNKLAQAIELQKAALALEPGDPALKLNLAKLLIKHGDKNSARAKLEEVARLGEAFRGQSEVAALLKAL